MPRNLQQFRLTAAILSLASLTCAGSGWAASGPAKTPQSSGPPATVVVDAGHGGFDRGGIPGQRIPEKEMTLDVAQRLKSILLANGYHVVMTRDSDVFVPLATRVAIANSYRNAIFVCVHFNSANRMGAEGIETYFYNRESLPLASAVHYFVAGGAPSANRGVRRRGFYVLRKTNVPAVLVECGFLTNPTEAQYAQTTSYRQKLADEIAAGIRGRFSVSSASSSTRVATGGTIPLQPYIDQTNIRSSKTSRSKHSRKSGTGSKSSKKKRSPKPTESEASTTPKQSEG
jgi:N-acetylmuramoyl-L-alanine amidase